jgi:hypothetical protein
MVDPELGAVESGRTGCAVKNDTGRMVRVGVESGSDGDLVVALALCALNHDKDGVDGAIGVVGGFVVVVACRTGVCVLILGCAFTNGGKGGKGGMVCGAVDGAHGGLSVVLACRAGVCVLILGCAFTNGGKGGKGGMVCGAVDGEEPELAPARAGVALLGCASTKSGKGGKDEVLFGVDCAIGVVHCALVVVVAPGRGCDNESDDCAVVGDGTIDLSLGRVVPVACVTDAEPLGLGTAASVCDGADCTVFVVTDVVVLSEGTGVSCGDSASLDTQKITAIAASTLKSSSPRSDPTPLVELRATELISVILTTFFRDLDAKETTPLRKQEPFAPDAWRAAAL